MSFGNGHLGLEELELLRVSANDLTSQQLSRRDLLRAHLEGCEECRGLAEAHKFLPDLTRSVSPSESCPDERVWLEMAAGLIADAESPQLMEHAAKCPACTARMNEALEVVGSDSIEDEAHTLASATKVWQRAQAERLRSAASPPAREPSSSRFRTAPPARRMRWWPVYSCAACLLVLLSVVYWYRSAHAIDQLIARAYDARRLTDLRIPGGDAVSLYSPARGISSSQEWPELLEVKLAAEKGLQQDPGSARWHQVLGRVFVIQAEPKSALSEFQIAETKLPSLPRIEFDLGTAYFELGDETHDSSDYGYAAERFSRFLATGQTPDPVTLYDRALCWQRMGINELAQKDFSDALQRERRPEWKREIRRQLDNLKQAPHAARTWAEPAANSTIQVEFADRSGDYEQSRAEIFHQGLSLSNSDNAARLQEAADSGRNHGDLWFSDWLEMSRHRPESAGDSALSKAIQANERGDAPQALDLAQRAEKYYSASNNNPGVAEAVAEAVYALQRMGRARDCLSGIQRARLLPALSRYSYLQIQLLLEQGSCLVMAGSLADSRGAVEEALAAAMAHKYPILYARGEGFLASYFTVKGLSEQGWDADVRGLWLCQDFHCPPMREYQFLSDLTDASISLNLTNVSVSVAQLATERALSAGNSQITAYAFEVLGQRQLESSRLEEAKRSFSTADSILTNLGDNASSREYRADWSSDRSELLELQGSADLALAQTRSVLSNINETQSVLIKLNYWSRRALLERASGKPADALSSAQTAVNYADDILKGLRSPADRRAWQISTRRAYVVLVDSLLQNNRIRNAWEAWESWRRSPDAIADSGPLDQNLRHERLLRADSPTQSTLVFARLVDHYVLFAIRGNDLSVSKLEVDPETLDQLIRTFSLLCADPQSRLSEIRAAGAQLFSTMHLAKATAGNSEIRIDAEPRLGRIPFTALTSTDGHFLGDHISVIVLSEDWTLHPYPSPSGFSPASHLLIVHAPAPGSQFRHIPLVYDESREVASKFRNVDLIESDDHSREHIVAALRSSDIFHFSGHSADSGYSSGLVLGADSNLPQAAFAGETVDSIAALHCRLVVLAACTTLGGTSRIAQLNSDLPGAFLRAGATDVVASSWGVDSQATRLLMLAFYDELVKGVSPASALMVAEGRLRNDPQFQHPFYWSAFSLLES
jgi:CHAT domain-containing protein